MSAVEAARFRIAVVADAAKILALVESAYRGDSSRAGWTTEADMLGGQRTDLAAVQSMIEDARGRFVLVERNAALLGCANIVRHDAWCYFGMFCVVPVRQGGGIGSLLLGECERLAREEWKLPQMRMSVIWPRSELIAWYQRRGYTNTHERLPFPYGDARFGLAKRDDLHFEVLVKALDRQ